MGTIPKISSHSPLAAEAVCGARLLLLWPAVFRDRSRVSQPWAFGFCLLQQNLTAVLSPACAGFRDEVSFRPFGHSPKETAFSFR